MSEVDRRCFRYRHGEARIFNAPEDVPEGEGWVDSPAKVAPADPGSVAEVASEDTEPVKKKRGRPRKDANNGDRT